jgi:chromosome segregation ATPase
LQKTQLATLPDEIEQLEETISVLRAEQGAQAANPTQHLPLPATLDLLSQHEAESEQLESQIRALEAMLPKKARELDRLEHELRPLEMQKKTAILAAKEAIKRKEEGERGIGDDLELKGRWYHASGATLSSAMEIDS